MSTIVVFISFCIVFIVI